ncbi:hypothetical protein [Flavivirga eckloniae]|uniref:GOLD domain-containing protein n=1 Tax=Flavivirga eckloniae TaxID=1803846 RepID=A0A2K9PKJ3_9FLAO|nr:hypothetical protein [Flavivirga eckloniae]AUP77574.1 hypothetical protein C1H87_02100 [Flavivirga eckloniae]
MKIVRLKMVAFALFMAASFVACSEDDGVLLDITKKTVVTNVAGDTTGEVDKEIPLDITFIIDNNCGTFSKLIKETTDKTTIIEVEAKYLGTNCGSTPSTKRVIYKFKAPTIGTYTLKFKKSATEFITHIIEIS